MIHSAVTTSVEYVYSLQKSFSNKRSNSFRMFDKCDVEIYFSYVNFSSETHIQTQTPITKLNAKALE